MEWWAISVCVLSFGFIGLSIGQFLHISAIAALERRVAFLETLAYRRDAQ